MSGKWKYLGNRPFEDEIDRRTPEQKRRDEDESVRLNQQFRIKLTQSQIQVDEWNAIGQYAKIGEFVFPVAIDDVYEPMSYSSAPYYQAKIKIGEQELTVFRLVSANASNPWLMKHEFVRQTGIHTFLNVVSRPWW